MAAKKKTKSVPKKTKAAVLTSKKPAATVAAVTKGFPQFQQFSGFQPFKMDQFQPFKMDQFKSFKMDTDMFKGNKQMEKFTQGAAVMGQDQMDALVKSSTIFAKGMEEILKTCMEIAQDAGEKSQSAAKTVMSCKTLNEFTDVQTKLAQTSFDEFMTNATRITEKAVKLCTEAMEPINDQMGKATKRASA